MEEFNIDEKFWDEKGVEKRSSGFKLVFPSVPIPN